MSLDFVVAIPARLASTRLPGKPLRLINNKPMILHVIERAEESGAREIVVATDAAEISNVVQESYPNSKQIRVCMTRADHQSGTDRLAETASICAWSEDQIVINLQGDEPMAPPRALTHVAALLESSTCEVATLATPIQSLAHFLDPNCVKVVCNDQQRALYFSRAPIPWPRDAFAANPNQWPSQFSAWRHIGLYGYRAGFLKTFVTLEARRLEQTESLEQLRILQSGYNIAVAPWLESFPHGVDTEADLLAAQSFFMRS